MPDAAARGGVAGQHQQCVGGPQLPRVGRSRTWLETFCFSGTGPTARREPFWFAPPIRQRESTASQQVGCEQWRKKGKSATYDAEDYINARQLRCAAVVCLGERGRRSHCHS